MQQSTTCVTKMTIYALKCECEMVYVGSCWRALKVRIGEHRSRIKNRNIDAPLVPHFLEKNHAPDSFQFTVLEQLRPVKFNKINLYKRLLQRESYWIYQLDTLTPGGLNCENELKCFLG